MRLAWCTLLRDENGSVADALHSHIGGGLVATSEGTSRGITVYWADRGALLGIATLLQAKAQPRHGDCYIGITLVVSILSKGMPCASLAFKHRYKCALSFSSGWSLRLLRQDWRPVFSVTERSAQRCPKASAQRSFRMLRHCFCHLR